MINRTLRDLDEAWNSRWGPWRRTLSDALARAAKHPNISTIVLGALVLLALRGLVAMIF